MDEDDLKAELTCPICMDLFSEPRRLPCGHVYCRVCLQDMLTRKYLNTHAPERILSCPECRQQYDLTFQHAGVDVFPRDFKLVRLVELCEKKFSRDREDEGGDRGAEAGADDQTAVKTATGCSTERTSSSFERVASSSALDQGSSLLQEQQNGSVHSSSSPAVSLTDDSWIYVPPENRLRPAVPINLQAYRQGSGDDSWLLPFHEGSGQFPVGSIEGTHGSAAVGYPVFAGDVSPIVNISGHYDNAGHGNFQRFVVHEPCVQVVHLPRNAPVTSQSSESSSESDTSDERGDEGSDERSGDEVNGSGSEAGSQGQNRRSRLSRFFRSLVMSDTDSYDEDDPAYRGCGQARQYPGPEQHLHHDEDVIVASHAGQRGRVMEMTSARSGPDVTYFESGAVAVCQPPVEIREGANAVAVEAVADGHDERNKDTPHDSNHNSLAEAGSCQRDTEAVSGAIPRGACGGGARASSASERLRVAIEDADDTDDEFEPQTSMLRPKRKPRSRLKKFFTSLLSLSSSDDDEEDEQQVEGQIASSTFERH